MEVAYCIRIILMLMACVQQMAQPSNPALDPCGALQCKFYELCQEDPPGSFQCLCPTTCPTKKEPVCGSNGKVYVNYCELQKDSCQNMGYIELITC